MNELDRIEIDLLLEGIYRHYGYDFRNYSYPSIIRRVRHRMSVEYLESITLLLDRVLHNEMAMQRLFNDFSITVTDMFRDPDCFLAFRQHVLPKLRALDTIRIWHAGCATGEEVYSMAILLHEEGLYPRATIYATDMNNEMIKRAGKGTFPLGKMKQYTKNYQLSGGIEAFSEYYNVHQNEAVFKPFLSRQMVFSNHNLVTDHSFNDFHVILCRNVMIYFNHALQKRVFKLFNESLITGGFLALGEKEGLPSYWHNAFAEVIRKQQIYKKL